MKFQTSQVPDNRLSNDLQANRLIGRHVLVADCSAGVAERRRLGGERLAVAGTARAAGRIAARSGTEDHGCNGSGVDRHP